MGNIFTRLQWNRFKDTNAPLGWSYARCARVRFCQGVGFAIAFSSPFYYGFYIIYFLADIFLIEIFLLHMHWSVYKFPQFRVIDCKGATCNWLQRGYSSISICNKFPYIKLNTPVKSSMPTVDVIIPVLNQCKKSPFAYIIILLVKGAKDKFFHSTYRIDLFSIFRESCQS